MVPENQSYGIIDLNVTLDLNHGFLEDLDVFLISPYGNWVELFTYIGGPSGGTFSATVLDDEADFSIDKASSPYIGGFQPEGSLSDFDGLPAAGVWTLRVVDTYRHGPSHPDEGTLDGWSITIAHAPIANSPPTAVDDSVTVISDGTPATLDLVANDTDVDGDPLSVDSVNTTGTAGIVTVTDGIVTYTAPSVGFEGTDSFTYVATDGQNVSNEATVDITVVPPASGSSFSVNDVSKREGRAGKSTTFTFTVSRSGDTTQQQTVDWTTVAVDPNGTPPGALLDDNRDRAPGEDSLSDAGQLVFLFGETSKSIPITVYGDADPEGDEVFLVQISYGASETATATGTILNDDKGTPVESASATDAALLAFFDLDSSDDDDTDFLIEPTVTDLALMMME